MNNLNRPGITQRTLEDNAIRPASEDEAKAAVGLARSGILIPYFDARREPIIDGRRAFARLRLEVPMGDRRYHSPENSKPHLYIPAATRSLIGKADELVVVEGEFKALALAEEGVAVVGLSGFYATVRGENGDAPKLLPELSTLIERHGTTRILFLGDSDTALNWQFADAAVKLAGLVDATVRLPRIPLDKPKGIDDCREELGTDFAGFWGALRSNAVEIDGATPRDDLAVLLFGREAPLLASFSPSAADPLVRKAIKLASQCQSALMRTNVGKLLKEHAGVSILDFRDEVDRASRERRESRREGPETAPLGDEELAREFGSPLRIGERSLSVNQPYFTAAYRKARLILFSPEEAQFYEYDSECGLWVPVTEDSVKNEFSRQLLGAAREFGEERLVTMRTDSLHTALKNQLKGQAERKEAFNSGGQFIHLANGMLDLNADPPELLEFDPGYYSRNQSPITLDETAECPRFLDELLAPALPKDDIDLLQRYCGSLLLGGNRAQRMLLITGTAKGGKSTLVEIIEAIVGIENVAEVRTAHLAERFELFRYVGKTLLTGKDVPARFLNQKGAPVLKKLTGGDLVDAEGKNQNRQVQFRGEFSVIITSNSRLHVKLEGDSAAWDRRLMIINYEKPPPEKRISHFARKLIAEEAQGILNWFIEGAVRHLVELDRFGDFQTTEAQDRRVSDLLSESDSVRAFVQDRVVRDESDNVTTEELLEAYSEYCETRNWQQQSKSRAERELPDVMLEVHRAAKRNDIKRLEKSRKGYSGVAIRPE